MARQRVNGVIDSELAQQVQRFHKERLEEAERQGLKVTHSKKGLGWDSPHGQSDYYSFSSSLEMVLREGLSQVREERFSKLNHSP